MDWKERLNLISHSHRGSYLGYVAIMLDLKVQRIAEIGVYTGKTSVWLRKLFPLAHIHLIDPWDYNEEYAEVGSPPTNSQDGFDSAYDKIVGMFGNDPQASIHKMASLEAAKIVPDGLDLVFIDGDHSYKHVSQDIKAWLPKVRSGGVFAGHDYCKQRFPDVVKAVDEIFGVGNVVLGQDTVWVYQVE